MILIGSCSRPQSIPLHRFAQFCPVLLPDMAIKIIGCKGRFSLVAKMANQVGAGFMRRSLLALHHWQGVERSELGAVFSMHGLCDPIIPYYKEHHDEMVAGGGHFIGLSHPARVGKFMLRIADAVRDGRPLFPTGMLRCSEN